MVIDNIAAKSESGMKPEEVQDREQRKQTWQALSETAVNGWKAMFAKPKRQRAEQAPYPAYMYGGLMVRHSPLLHCALRRVNGQLLSMPQFSLQGMQYTRRSIHQTWQG